LLSARFRVVKQVQRDRRNRRHSRWRPHPAKRWHDPQGDVGVPARSKVMATNNGLEVTCVHVGIHPIPATDQAETKLRCPSHAGQHEERIVTQASEHARVNSIGARTTTVDELRPQIMECVRLEIAPQPPSGVTVQPQWLHLCRQVEESPRVGGREVPPARRSPSQSQLDGLARNEPDTAHPRSGQLVPRDVLVDRIDADREIPGSLKGRQIARCWV